jgi:PAS domain S-box-containing protein
MSNDSSTKGCDIRDALAHDAFSASGAAPIAAAGPIWDASSDLLCVLDSDARFQRVNAAWQATLGWSESELAGMTAFELVHPEDLQRSRARFSRLEAGDPVLRGENRYRCKDGSYRWLSWMGVPEGGRFYCNARDITEDKDQALDEARRIAQHSRLWRIAHDLLVVADLAGVYHDVNPAWTATLGWKIEEVIGRSFLEFVHPDDHAASLRVVANAPVGGGLAHCENRYRHKDGGYRWMSWAVATENGLIYATGRHITLEREASQTLERSEARLRSIFETSYQLQGLLDLDGTLLDANATSLNAVKAKLEDVIGKPFWETPWITTTPGLPANVQAAFKAAVAGASVRQEITIHGEQGLRTYDFSLRPVRDEHGDIVAVMPEAMETTERRAAEEALRQSRKLEAMGQLTGGVAHDFNNLLTPIMGSLDLLRELLAGREREQRLIGNALQAADRAKTLVQRLLAFARRQPLQAMPVDLRKLILGMTDLIATTTGPGIELAVDLAVDLAPAMVDANQFEMAILNLCVNARDAMPAGGRLLLSAIEEEVTADHRCGASPGTYVRLAVTDTGVGMDDDTLARSIEPFFSTKGVGKGTGLGLSMVHGLVAQLDGALTIRSVPMHGTTVELWLPTSTLSTSHAAPAQTSPPRPRAETLALLVDDDDLVRASTAETLSELGYAVIEAASGDEAMRKLESGSKVDVLITDYQMPGMTGVELAMLVRRQYPVTRILLVSGYADHQGVPAEIPRLTKPYRRADLASALAAMTSGVD